jgi:AcrR family transcriptional regulator
VDTEGIDGLTVRRLAERLGVGQMTLYGYFRTKEEIVDRLGARVLGDLAADLSADGRWDQRLAEDYRRIRATLRRHPAAGAFLVSPHATHGPELDRVRDTLLGLLLGAGFDPAGAVAAIAVLTSYVVGFSQVEAARAARDPADEQLIGLPHLDHNAYPHLASVAEHWADRTGEHAFETGLNFLIDGLRRSLG